MELGQFRILYRKFLFRIVDLELISSGGELSKLLGQFAALLIFLSVLFSIAVLFGARPATSEETLLVVWSFEHFMIATTMLVVGLFAVVTWHSAFLDRNDVLTLAPLPIRSRTLFLAKVTAVGASLLLVILFLNVFTSFTWTAAFSTHPKVRSIPVLTSDPSITPIESSELKPLLDADIMELPSGTGVTIGVTKHGMRSVFAYGAARPESVFDIGSLTKTFTGLLLGQMSVQSQITLDEPLRKLLPVGGISQHGNHEITLLDLATHRAGLPVDLSDRDYSPERLYEFVSRRGLAKPPAPMFLYSNLGFSLLGQALANRSRAVYSDLLQHTVIDQLGMNHTVVLESSLGSDGIESTAGDLLTYLEANLHPEKFDVMSAGLKESHVLRAAFAQAWAFGRAPEQIALAWAYDSDSEAYWHDGGAMGYSSMAIFCPKDDYAAVVLLRGVNTANIAGRIALRIQQRLVGKPAVSLTTIDVPANFRLAGTIRWFLAFWTTVLMAGAFMFCFVLGIQGLASQLLPRRMFLRVSVILQLLAFCVLVAGYFLQPTQITEPVLIAAQQNGLLAWSPSYWFLGLFQELSGSPALALLAHRALVGITVAVAATVVTYALSYFRTLQKIVEEPEIAPAYKAFSLPLSGEPQQMAMVRFSLHTFLRSRQHRMMFAFYLGVGFALTILFMQTPLAEQLSGFGETDPWHEASIPLLASSVLMMGFCILGMRAVVSMPIDLGANWIFRIMPAQRGNIYLMARRWTLWFVVTPLWLGWTILLLWSWPFWLAVGHLLVLGLVAVIGIELSVLGPQKIPFTCSYLPGKSNFHMTFWACMGLAFALVTYGVTFELRALHDIRGAIAMLILLSVTALITRWRTESVLVNMEPQFEDLPDPVVLILDLHQDGVPSIPSISAK